MKLGIDTGGTFTDAVLYDNSTGVVKSAKSMTTHHDLILGISDVIDRINCVDMPLSQYVDVVSVSTTLATNSIVESRGGSVCLLLIGHDAKSLHKSKLNEALRGDPVEFIAGGHTVFGEQQMDLDIDSAKDAILRHADSVTAFAVSGMFSVRNTEHELAVRELVLELTDKPVTCTYELTSNLDAPRRAMTAVLNARLIAPIKELIEAIRSEMKRHSIDAPLMVVKGDGSMTSADIAVGRPVETILSGPAASVVGACTLADGNVSVVSDIGGTTTDIAVLKNGAPVIARNGAVVGGFNTFIETVEVFTSGIGGDSQVRFDRELLVGPNRCLPICVLGHQNSEVLEVLKAQLERGSQQFQGCFVLRRRSTEDVNTLNKTDRDFWNQLGSGMVDCESLFAEPRFVRAYERLRALDLVQMAAFTPTDALHVLGRMKKWSTPAAKMAAELWVRGFEKNAPSVWSNTREFSLQVIESVVRQTSRALVHAAIQSNSPNTRSDEIDGSLLSQAMLVKQSGSLRVKLSLDGMLSVVGAPAKPIYSHVAKRLNTKLVIPRHSEVGNAVGAAAGSIFQRVSGLITSPDEGIYRAHLPNGVVDFPNLEDAAWELTESLKSVAGERVATASAVKPQYEVERSDVIVNGFGGRKIFIESNIVVNIRSDIDAGLPSA